MQLKESIKYLNYILRMNESKLRIEFLKVIIDLYQNQLFKSKSWWKQNKETYLSGALI